jgi:hypothetical protein
MFCENVKPWGHSDTPILVTYPDDVISLSLRAIWNFFKGTELP